MSGSDAPSYFLAAARNERQFLLQHAHFPEPQYRREPFSPLDTHLRLLDMYEKAIPHVLPRDAALIAPTLKHPDLTLSNVFVSESGPAHFTGVIDWQHASILPFITYPITPDLIEYCGKLIYMDPEALFPGPLPANLDALDVGEQERYRVEHRLAMREKMFQILRQRVPRVDAALAHPLCNELVRLPVHAMRTWADSVLELRQTLITMREWWDEVAPGTTCPISFTADELAEHEQQCARFRAYEQASGVIGVALSLLGDGHVMDKDYDAAKESLQALEQQWDEEACGARFPYRDGAYSFFLS